MQITGFTKLVGIIADPVAHVRTPQMFNAAARRMDVQAVCVPFHVPPAQLGTWLAACAGLGNLAGLVVTIPHKEAVMPFCDTLTDTAKLVGSANVLRLEHATGRWVGGNFDGHGFVAGLHAQGYSLAGQRVLQIGAGGAGKSMAYSILRDGAAELVIANRAAEKAVALAQQLRSALPSAVVRHGGTDPRGFDVIVNATSVGLTDDSLPVDIARLDAGTLVCEAVVREGGTALLRAAAKRGCAVHPGEWMLRGQIVEIARFLGFTLDASSGADREQ
jgi:shikimate dehydrogenase